MDQSTKTPKARKRAPETKLAQHRLSALELSKELCNVAEACRQRGLDRTSFYEWKRRFQTQGFEGLKDLPPIHKSHPQTTPPETPPLTICSINCRSDREQDLEQAGPDQPLRCDRRATEIDLKTVKILIEAGERVIHDLSDLAQRVSQRDAVLKIDIAE